MSCCRVRLLLVIYHSSPDTQSLDAPHLRSKIDVVRDRASRHLFNGWGQELHLWELIPLKVRVSWKNCVRLLNEWSSGWTRAEMLFRESLESRTSCFSSHAPQSVLWLFKIPSLRRSVNIPFCTTSPDGGKTRVDQTSGIASKEEGNTCVFLLMQGLPSTPQQSLPVPTSRLQSLFYMQTKESSFSLTWTSETRSRRKR